MRRDESSYSSAQVPHERGGAHRIAAKEGMHEEVIWAAAAWYSTARLHGGQRSLYVCRRRLPDHASLALVDGASFDPRIAMPFTTMQSSL